MTGPTFRSAILNQTMLCDDRDGRWCASRGHRFAPLIWMMGGVSVTVEFCVTDSEVVGRASELV
jgi:hypothetical protein